MYIMATSKLCDSVAGERAKKMKKSPFRPPFSPKKNPLRDGPFPQNVADSQKMSLKLLLANYYLFINTKVPIAPTLRQGCHNTRTLVFTNSFLKELWEKSVKDCKSNAATHISLPLQANKLHKIKWIGCLEQLVIPCSD